MNIRSIEFAFSDWRLRFQQVSGATLALMITGTITRLITLLTQIVIAREFGLTVFSDAYFATENIPELFLDFIAIGFSMVFIPMFATYRVTRGDENAKKFASSFFFLSTFLSLIFAGVAAAGAPLFVRIMAPGFDGIVQQTAVKLVRIMSLSIVFFGLSGGIRGLLQSNKEFIIPELARVAYNCSLFIFALTLAHKYGVFVLAWGIVFGAMLQLFIQILGALKTGALKLVWVFDHPGIRQAARQLLPFILAIAGIKIVFVLDRMVASGLAEGGVAALNYASRIILLPVGLFALPLRTTLYPSLSTLAAQNQQQKLAHVMLSGLRVLLFIVIPACVGLVVLHIPLTQLFFERGAFDRAATLATSQAVIYYAIGVPAIAMLFLLNNVYLSLNAPYSLVKFNLFNWLANLLFSLVLSRYWGHYGIALGTSISVTLTMMAMIYSLRRHQLKSLDVKSLINSGFKIGLVSAVMGLLLLLLLNTSDQIPAQPSQYFRFLQLTGLAAIGTLTYVVVGRWLNLDEWSLIKTVFGKL